MKPVRSRLRRLVPVLLALIGALAGCSSEALPVADAQRPSSTPARGAPVSPSTDAGSTLGLDLSQVPEARHRSQIERVVESMDATGVPPRGVFQGGRRGGARGVFQNAEGRLPRKPRGYWVESDVWPKNGPRDAERLIFGRDREVYWTRDHYETFVRLR